jgi:tetratricopeptide (TPR) repeat protein
MARLLNVEPNNLYNRALSLYTNGQYWDAYFVFGRIAVEYPDFFKRDWVSYYMASCLENLDMRNASLGSYSHTLSDYPKSTVVPYADLGMMRVYYRQEDYASVAKQMYALNQPEVHDSLKAHAYYIMGQTHMRLGEYRKARQLFGLVPASHPEYPFARHSLAVVNVFEGSMHEAAENLRACIATTARTPEQEEIVNRSMVLLGYVLYEMSNAWQGALSQCVTVLRNVPKTSYYYEDALLGLGWAAIRAHQWEDCAQAGEVLRGTAKHFGLRSEGALLNAYALMMRKNYSAAVGILSDALTELETHVRISKDSLDVLNRMYGATRGDYNEIAARAQELAASRQSSHVLGLIDSLGNRQQDRKRAIDAHLRFLDENGRSEFFARTLSKIKEDVEYALAISQKLGGVAEAAKVQKDLRTKEKQIDQEIERLKEKMETLEDKEQKPEKKKEQPKQKQLPKDTGKADTQEETKAAPKKQ